MKRVETGARIRRLGVVVFKRGAKPGATIKSLREWAEQHGVSLLWHSSARPWLRRGEKLSDDREFVRRSQLVLSLGGDGTLLSAARLVGDSGTPLVGMNHGRLGFLADLSDRDGLEVLSTIAAGHGILEARTVLSVSVVRGRRIVHRDRALNEIFLRGSRDLAMIEIEVRTTSEGFLSDYWADGLLVATPTGSTAYSLAVGGPIVRHDVPCVVLTPVAPHSLNVRPLVLPDREGLSLRPRAHDGARLLVDGRHGFDLEPGDEVRVVRSSHPVHLLRPKEAVFSDALRSKLGWSGAPRLPGRLPFHEAP
ncbi:MAG: NAD(+)/NADH kinase [Fibrobacteria bacterium]|nr:NAD(+)/NADH kinase [Fibrobacteria bacterium]